MNIQETLLKSVEYVSEKTIMEQQGPQMDGIWVFTYFDLHSIVADPGQFG
jgi:hypothetical protein